MLKNNFLFYFKHFPLPPRLCPGGFFSSSFVIEKRSFVIKVLQIVQIHYKMI